MQKDLEVLRSEDGLVIKRLSPRKLIFIQKVPIYIYSNDNKVMDINLKFRYIESKNVYSPNVDFILMNRSKIINSLSRKFFIKMDKFDWIGSSNPVLEIGENKYKFDIIIKGLYICDKVWARDYLIKKILENDITEI
jgi:hypothetical protein